MLAASGCSSRALNDLGSEFLKDGLVRCRRAGDLLPKLSQGGFLLCPNTGSGVLGGDLCCRDRHGTPSLVSITPTALRQLQTLCPTQSLASPAGCGKPVQAKDFSDLRSFSPATGLFLHGWVNLWVKVLSHTSCESGGLPCLGTSGGALATGHGALSVKGHPACGAHALPPSPL